MSGRRARADRQARRDRLAFGFLRAFGRLVREQFARRAPAYFREHPDAARPCATCWVREKPDGWEGWDSSTAGLMDAVRGQARFLCHHGCPSTPDGWRVDPKASPPCAAFAVLMSRPEEARTAVVLAAVETKPRLSDRRSKRIDREALRKTAQRLSHFPATCKGDRD